MWGGQVTGDTLPHGWKLCDGTALDSPPLPGDAPAFYQSSDGSYRVPDLRGLFVRGLNIGAHRPTAFARGDPDGYSRTDMFDQSRFRENMPYSLQKDAYGTHQHGYTSFPAGADWNHVCPAAGNFWDPTGYELTTTLTGNQPDGAAESRPFNIYLYFLIYVGDPAGTKQPQGGAPAAPESSGAQAPAGMIALWGALQAPPGWLICDGLAHQAPQGPDGKRTLDDYKYLRDAVLKGYFGDQPQDPAQLLVPDLGGEFIRGFDRLSPPRDPDHDQRVRSQQSSYMGSMQGEAIVKHQHAYQRIAGKNTSSDPAASCLDKPQLTWDPNGVTGPSGASETRPRNAAFHHIIKVSQLQSTLATLPIGAIVMWPNEDPPSGWLICNGDSPTLDRQLQALAKVIGDTFRPDHSVGALAASDEGYLYLPDLQGAFVRGVDDGAVDPDAAKRTDLKGSTQLGAVVGSYEKAALFGHCHEVVYFPDRRWRPASSSRVRQRMGQRRPADLDYGGSETPHNVYLNFIIKYASIERRSSVLNPSDLYQAT